MPCLKTNVETWMKKMTEKCLRGFSVAVRTDGFSQYCL